MNRSELQVAFETIKTPAPRLDRELVRQGPEAIVRWSVDTFGDDIKQLKDSGLSLITGDSMADAAQKVVKAVGTK